MADPKPMTAHEIQALQPGQMIWGYNSVFGFPHSIVGPLTVISQGIKTESGRDEIIAVVVLDNPVQGREEHRVNELTNEFNGVFPTLQDASEYFHAQTLLTMPTVLSSSNTARVH